MDFFTELIAWFSDNWQGDDGVWAQSLTHIRYSVIATAIAAVIALPIGLGLGHTGRGGTVAINVSNFGRAIPSFGLIMIAYIALGLSLTPVLITLVAIAIPPMLTNSYVAVRSVDREIKEAARGMGMTGWQVLMRAELPVAMPLVMAGIRTSAVQVVATATLAAFVGLEGLGRFIIDGLPQQDFHKVIAGAVLVALLSIGTEYGLALVQRFSVSRGIAERNADAGFAAKMTATAR
jgi:osmoprotectant transport system permease protein